MRNAITNNRFNDMPITEIVSISSSAFFTILLALSAYLMSIYQLHYGFLALAASSIYFAISNAFSLKLFTSFAWGAVAICAIRGVLGV